MYQRGVAHKGFLICMVLFCAFMQWSPAVDLDYVWINGHEHYVGAANPHQVGKMVVPSVRQAGGASLKTSHLSSNRCDQHNPLPDWPHPQPCACEFLSATPIPRKPGK